MKEQFYDDQLSELQSVGELTRVINGKVFPLYSEGMQAIKAEGSSSTNNVKSEIASNPRIVKGVLLSMVLLVNNLTLEKKEWGFSSLKEHFGSKETIEKIEATTKFKGKMLLGLKEYPRLNLKRAFWRWYLNTTGSGDNLFQKAANNLVLYTNINKITSFYRILGTVRSRMVKVHPRVKRMTTMIYLYTRYFFDRTIREAFQKIRGQGRSKKTDIAEKLIACARLRKLSALRIWGGETKLKVSAE